MPILCRYFYPSSAGQQDLQDSRSDASRLRIDEFLRCKNMVSCSPVPRRQRIKYLLLVATGQPLPPDLTCSPLGPEKSQPALLA